MADDHGMNGVSVEGGVIEMAGAPSGETTMLRMPHSE